jgi:S-adenosylmethionine synthetase
MSYLFTSESVSEGHPDKVSDQISDALLDHYLYLDPNSKVACETLVSTGLVVLSGEVKSESNIDHVVIVRDVIDKIGYNHSEYKFDAQSCGILNAIHEQSSDINQGVERENPEEQGAGDQGMMFGYATNETEDYIPLPLYLSHKILIELAELRRENKEITYLRPDAKSQVTVKYDDDGKPESIDTVVVSTQHDEFIKPVSDKKSDKKKAETEMLAKIKNDVKNILIPRLKKKLKPEISKLFTDKIKYEVNPTGKFVIGGPHGDTGLTGRKIIVDTYGGKGAHGGGAFSGKDPSKVDRSAAYAARYLAKNMVAAGVCDEVLVQVSYAIGVAKPVGLYINTYGKANVDMTDEEIQKKIMTIFDLRPYFIERDLKLRNPIYSETASYGHMGRKHQTKKKEFIIDGKKVHREVELFTWEALDKVSELKSLFGLT